MATTQGQAKDYTPLLTTQKYPSKQHALNVKNQLLSSSPSADPNGVIFLESAKSSLHEDSDAEAPLRQRRPFFYMSGCELPDSYLVYDMKEEKLVLFIPGVQEEEVIWSGLPLSCEEAMEKYDVDEVQTTPQLNAHLASKTTTIYAIPTQVSSHITFLSFQHKNFDLLKPAIEYARVAKTDFEIALIQRANEVSTRAHVAVMAAAKSSQNETELEGILMQHFLAGGSKHTAYHSIVASGTSAATLHYVKNDAPLKGKDLLLLDAGCELSCYASDITRTFPITGSFTKESREIYDIVLEMQKKTIETLKAGVSWDETHLLAHRIAISGLLSLGILHGGTVEEILAARTSVAFFPHGLGHYLGLDTHDTGGDPNYSDEDPMFRYLRKRGELKERSVITVEPGIYFCRFILDPVLKDKEGKGRFIDEGVLERYWSVGGVRIEDNILITKDGYENLTGTPKEADEILKIINGGSSS